MSKAALFLQELFLSKSFISTSYSYVHTKLSRSKQLFISDIHNVAYEVHRLSDLYTYQNIETRDIVRNRNSSCPFSR
jgi:hypothetical protein